MTQPSVLTGGGQMGALMRAHDWSASPLGPPESWPQALQTVTALLLQSRFPMFVAWGPELGFLYNDSYAEILGAKHPAALGRRFRDIWSEIWADISPLIDAAMGGEAIYRQDLPLVMNRKGYDEQTWFTFSYSPVRDESGTVAGMFCAVSETTQHILSERALRESEGRLRAFNETLERRVDDALAQRKVLADIVEGTNALVQVVDMEYRWLAINRAAADAFERLFGVRPAVGDSVLEILAPQRDRQVSVQAPWRRALAGEEFVTIEEIEDVSRGRLAFEMRFNTLRDRDGRQTGAYLFAYDITERLRDQERLRTTEAALRQAQKMESLGQLTGGVAHDFNNLLAVFSNGLHVLERTSQPPQVVFDAMRRAIARGTGLTRHLLAFSRRQPVKPESIDVAAHLHGMRAMLDGSLGGHITVEMRFASDLWPIEVDAGELELAILNLCVNARDALPDGGVITITAENVRSLAGEGPCVECVKISVADDGCGMPRDVVARVFEPFFTTKDISKGSGLGLPQVYGFATQSGGEVSVDSAVGTGTIVTLILPRCLEVPVSDVQARERVPVVPPRGSARRGHVLLVEDDHEVSALTRELLSALGFAVTHVVSAEGAFAALANAHGIDLMLSDVMMPGGVSGLQLARQIREDHPELPIILATGYVEAVAGMQDGEFQLLTKPFTLEALADALGVEAR